MLALAEALFRQGRIDAAGQVFRRARRLLPENAAVHYGLARVLLTHPDYAGAGTALRRAFRLDPDDPRIVRRLAGLVSSRDEALALYRRYTELPPVEDPEVRENVRAWLALLESIGQRRLFRLEGPEGFRSLRVTRAGGVPHVNVGVGPLAPRPFLLDSGASGVTVPFSTFRRLGLQPVSRFTVKGVSGATAEHPFVVLPTLSLGPYLFHDIPAVVMSSREGGPGILGLSLLAPLQPGLVGGRTLLLEKNAARGTGCPVAGWWRFRNVNGMIQVEALLEGTPIEMLLDTGATRSVLSRAALKRMGIEESVGRSSIGIRGLTGAVGKVGRVKKRGTLAALGRRFNVRGMSVVDLGALSHSLGTEIDGILGADFLETWSLRMDYGNGLIEVREGRGKNRPG